MGRKIMQITEQLQQWNGEFGKQYTQRNQASLEQLDELYMNMYGLSRLQLNQQFLADLPKDLRILEVGCNIGNQLCLLQQMGFTDLSGVEIQEYALQQARLRLPQANLIQGSALQLPFSEAEFDLVFTSGVLIHIHPENLAAVMSEIYRCSRKYIWGLEYYAQELTDVPYREQKDLMWKAPYADLYTQQFNELKTLKRQQYPYLTNANRDEMFLLKK